MVGRTELVIDLATKFPKKTVLEFMELRRKICLLENSKQAAKEEYEEKLEEINSKIIELSSECKHPHTYLTSGGQYESQDRICSICDREL